MSGRKRLFILFPLLLLLGSCSPVEVINGEVWDAVAAEVLLSPEVIYARNQEAGNITTVEAIVEDMVMPVNISLSAHYPVSKHLYFVHNEGYIELYAGRRDRVSYGDVLAHLRFDTTAGQIAYDRAKNELAIFNNDFSEGLAARRWAVDEARAALEGALPDRVRLLNLELMAASLELERFQIESSATRARLTNAVDALRGDRYGEAITAPFDGVVLSAYTFRGDIIHSNMGRILTVAYDGVVFLSARSMIHANRFDVLRIGDVIRVNSTNTHLVNDEQVPIMEFYARVVSDEWAGGNRNSFNHWLLPIDMEAFIDGKNELDNLTFVATVDFPLSRGDILIPSRAVHPEDTRDFVFIYNDGAIGKRYVQIGVRSAGMVQILAGLEPGDLVVIV